MKENMEVEFLLKKQKEILLKGIEEVIPIEDFEERLKKSIQESKPLIVKLGIDPTNPELHLGHSLVLKKLKDFQKCGHQIILLIGDATARIGDPSGRSKMRPILTKADIQKNMLSYRQQIEKIIDFNNNLSLRYNSEWLFKMSFEDIMQMASQYTLARILEREDFKKRYQQNVPISLSEIFYPLIQGYDSYVLEADIEIGGIDQRFNLLWGRAIQKDFGKASQIAITVPILEGLDGVNKMSKSLSNHISLMDSSKDFFGKLMSIPDTLMFRYMELLSSYNAEKIQCLKEAYEKQEIHPKKIKEELAYDITSHYHGEALAKKEWEDFLRVFSKKQIPENTIHFLVDLSVKNFKDFIDFIIAIPELNLKSRTEIKRSIEAGSIYLNLVKIKKETNGSTQYVEIRNKDVLQFGKRFFVSINFTDIKNSITLKL